MPTNESAARSTRPAAGGSSPAAPPPASPLDESQFALVQEAARNYKPIKRAAWIALGSAITTLVIGVSAVPLALIWPSFSGALITVGLCVIGVVEFMGYRKLRQADPSAARWLGTNQLAFLGLIVFYCLFQMLSFSPEDAKAASRSKARPAGGPRSTCTCRRPARRSLRRLRPPQPRPPPRWAAFSSWTMTRPSAPWWAEFWNSRDTP